MFKCLHLNVSISILPSPCHHLHVTISTSPSPSPYVSLSMTLRFRNSTNGKRNWRKTAASVYFLQMENGNGKPRFVCCKWKQTFVFLGRQMINGNRRLLFQHMCPSMENAINILLILVAFGSLVTALPSFWKSSGISKLFHGNQFQNKFLYISGTTMLNKLKP